MVGITDVSHQTQFWNYFLKSNFIGAMKEK
jgi:hypothetical protein